MMGLFDTIVGPFECPECGEPIPDFQTKDTECFMGVFTDFIPELAGQQRILNGLAHCPKCDDWVNISVDIIEGVISPRQIDRYDTAAVRQLLIDTLVGVDAQRYVWGCTIRRVRNTVIAYQKRPYSSFDVGPKFDNETELLEWIVEELKKGE